MHIIKVQNLGGETQAREGYPPLYETLIGVCVCSLCSIVGAVSPPGGDFSDPVTAQTLNIVQVQHNNSYMCLICIPLPVVENLCNSYS